MHACSVMFDSLFVTPWTSLPGPSVHGIFQARTLEWVAISFPRGIFPTQGSNRFSCISCIGRQVLLPLVPPGKSRKKAKDPTGKNKLFSFQSKSQQHSLHLCSSEDTEKVLWQNSKHSSPCLTAKRVILLSQGGRKLRAVILGISQDFVASDQIHMSSTIYLSHISRFPSAHSYA